MSEPSSFEVRLLGPGDAAVLERVMPGAFDHDIQTPTAESFLADPHHHLAVAVEDGVVIGFASAIDYVHPDKPVPELWIDEVGVAPDRQGRGVAKAILRALLAHAREIGCGEAWVLTDRGNAPALRLYATSGGREAPGDMVMYSFRLDDSEGQ